MKQSELMTENGLFARHSHGQIMVIPVKMDRPRYIQKDLNCPYTLYWYLWFYEGGLYTPF